MSEYALHPDEFADLDDICEYIAQDNIGPRGLTCFFLRSSQG